MASDSRRAKLWDLPVRLIHWSFVVLLPLLWWTAENGEMDLHMTLGLVMLGLVVFRVLWGLVGSSTARFASFVRGPITVISYLRGLSKSESETSAGHNPAGGWSVVLLLGLLAVDVGLGLIAQNVDGVTGSLNYLVSYDQAEQATELHELGFNILLAVIVLHIAAILFYTFVKKDRLVPPMITGSKDLPTAVTTPVMAPAWRILPCLLIAAALTWWVSIGAPTSLEQFNAPPPVDASEYM